MARRLVPSLNRILVEKIVPHSKTYSGISLRGKTTKLNYGKVVAVGPGAHDNDGKLITVSVKEGDTVLLPNYGGTKVKLGDKERVLDRGCGSKRLKRRIDLKRSTSSIGIVERIEYDPNRSSRIALVRWVEGVQRKCNMIEEFAPPHKILEPTMTTIRGLFSFSSLPRKVDQRKVAWEKNVFLSAFSSSKAKCETASLSFSSSFGFPRVAVAGAKPTFFAPRMREKPGGKNTFSLCEVRKLRPHSSLWAHRIKRKAALSWQSFRRQDTLGLVEAAEHNKSKPKTDQCSLPSKLMGKRRKHGECKVNRAPVTYIIASHQLEADSMVMNCDRSKPSIIH